MLTFPNNRDDRAGESPEIVLLRETASRLSAAVSLRDAVDEVARFVTTVVECDSCQVYVFRGDELILEASANHHQRAVQQPGQRMGQDIAGWIAQNREPVVIAERAFEDRRFRLFSELPGHSCEAFLSIPLISGGKSVGAINVQSLIPRVYIERDVRMIRTIGSLLGATIIIARLTNENALLSERIAARSLVDRAKHILQCDLGISEKDAYRTIQLESQRRNKPMSNVAEAVITREELKRSSRQRGSDGFQNRRIATFGNCQGLESPQSKT